MRIVLGLCLYLNTLEGRSTKRVNPMPKWERAHSTDPRTLLVESEVLTVTGENILSSDDQRFYSLMKEKGLSVALKEMGVHFRSAHWRRPPGKGDDRTAPKTVRVRSCYVRPDRLPPEGLPPNPAASESETRRHDSF